VGQETDDESEATNAFNESDEPRIEVGPHDSKRLEIGGDLIDHTEFIESLNHKKVAPIESEKKNKRGLQIAEEPNKFMIDIPTSSHSFLRGIKIVNPKPGC
jgi:hypothetical protein